MKKNTKILLQTAFLLFLIVGTVLIIRQQQSMPYHTDRGLIFGTEYSITYQHEQNLQREIEAELQRVDHSLSPFNPNSVITRFNNNQDTVADQMFREVFDLAMKVSEETQGAFDITVAPLVNVWGFGFKHDQAPGTQVIDSLKALVGYQKVSLTREGKLKKADPRMMLDCGAIAKGYGCDVVARLLRRHGVANFIVEIGGEVVSCGVSEKRLPWRIGVTKPTDDSLNVSHELQTILNVTDRAMATSGNYRNFYYKGGKKYAHTIDPRTGYPVQHGLLSATVLAADCATADAYATSFMVMGIDRAKELLGKHRELLAYFIYAGPEGENLVWFSESLRDKILGEH